MSNKAWDAKRHSTMFTQIEELYITENSEMIHQSLIKTQHLSLKAAVQWISEQTDQEFDQEIWDLMTQPAEKPVTSKEASESACTEDEEIIPISKEKKQEQVFDPEIVEECAQRQEEELFLLQSMYTEDEITIEGKSVTVIISPKASAVFHLPPNYPTEALFQGYLRLDYANSGSHSDTWFSRVEAEYYQEECLCSAVMMAQEYFSEIVDDLEATETQKMTLYSFHLLLGRSSQSIPKGRILVKLFGSLGETEFLSLNTPPLEKGEMFSAEVKSKDVGNIQRVQSKSRGCKRSMQIAWLDVGNEEFNYRCTVPNDEFWVSDSRVIDLHVEVKR